ncbi:major facilitator superfamily domain-containing protein [Coniella lustricola]|uniref:Major facilitator superfamily domain-containing protein n=1 Tax=Coniella lustricola TaxID=2025994 RepID=A0A2T3A8W7_9PEZI|nr:major facilitator superfamily domain-containing protein [Coniella lustricola]
MDKQDIGHCADDGDIPVSQNELTNATEKPVFTERLCLKIDAHVLLPMFFLNFLSLMGRTNIGAALVQKLVPDLHLDSIEVFFAIAITTAPIIVLEIPSQILMRFLRRKAGLPHSRYLCALDVGLGVVTLAQAFDQIYGQLLTTRFLVGVFDAGLIPGCVYIVGLYYPGTHLQWRLTMLMVGNICSNMIGSILAYAVAEIHADNGFRGWRWIFIVEGAVTILIALLCSISRLAEPSTATFLTPEEKSAIAANVELVQRTPSKSSRAAEWRSFLLNPLIYIWAMLYVFSCNTTSSIAVFAPTLVQSFHPTYTTPQVQAQVVPIFAVSVAVTLLIAYLADRTDHRCGFALVGYILQVVGCAVLLHVPADVYPQQNGAGTVAMLGLYCIAIGGFISLPMIWTLTLLNYETTLQRAIACGFVVGVGNVGGFTSSWLFRTSQGPYYHEGILAILIMTAAASVLLMFTLSTMVVLQRKALRRGSRVDRIYGSEKRRQYRYERFLCMASPLGLINLWRAEPCKLSSCCYAADGFVRLKLELSRWQDYI